jgi:hypothetical protein
LSFSSGGFFVKIPRGVDAILDTKKYCHQNNLKAPLKIKWNCDFEKGACFLDSTR